MNDLASPISPVRAFLNGVDHRFKRVVINDNVKFEFLQEIANGEISDPRNAHLSPSAAEPAHFADGHPLTMPGH